MTREEAIKIVRNIYQTDAEKEALGTLVPELAESEDERIRTRLLEYFHGFKDSVECPVFWEGLNIDNILTWLEKQKEQKPIAESKKLANEVIEYLTRCGYSPVLKDDSKKEHLYIDIPRHKDDFWLSEEYKHCRSVLGEYYMEGDHGGDTYTLYVWRTKKEQKPTDEQFPPLEGLDAIKAKYYDDGFKNGFDEGVESVKPAEWSEEDEKALKIVIDVFKEAGIHLIHYPAILSWLQRLKPKLIGSPARSRSVHCKP